MGSVVAVPGLWHTGSTVVAHGPRDCGAWWAAVSGVAQSQTRLKRLSISSSIGKESDAGRDWGQEERGTTEDEMAGWHLHSVS